MGYIILAGARSSSPAMVPRAGGEEPSVYDSLTLASRTRLGIKANLVQLRRISPGHRRTTDSPWV
jgi:hypothetical protein